MKRLPPSPTQKIDHNRKISFKFDGRSLTGLAGDSIATALYANDVRIFSRSIKYHRPRGLYGMDGECSNCLVEVDGLPNVPAARTPLRQGMTVKPQNVAGSAQWDWLGFMDRLDWAMPAGFYYRVFHKPYDLWPFFMNRIRQAAGIGRLNPNWPGGRYDELHLNAEVCVLGGGPAGLSAALAAADQGLRVVLFEARPWLGGFYDWRVREDAQGTALYQRAAALTAALAEKPDVQVFTHAFVNGLWGDNLVTAFQPGRPEDHFDERYIEVRAKSVIVATGCIERPLIFENNDRPGVMQAGCAHRLARTYGLLPGKSAVFSVGHDLGLEAAIDLADLGLKIPAVADCRVDRHDPDLVEALAKRNIPFLSGWAASKVEGDKGLDSVLLVSLGGTSRRRVGCQVLVASAGLTPAGGPLWMAQAKMAYDPHTNFYLPRELPPGVQAAGRLLAYRDPDSIEASGRLAGLAAALDCGAEVEKEYREAQERLSGLPRPAKGSKLVLAPNIGLGRRSFVCFDEDATVKHIAQACEQGFDVPELAKRFTAAGTGPGQGGVPGHNLPLLISQLRGEGLEEPAPTTIRPPLVPTLLAVLAGPKHDLFKRTPLHEAQEKAGAIFRRIGPWKRARYFSQDLTSREEIEAVHNGVGLIDVSTLGKFRLFGPDALQALQRVYVGDMAKIPEGRVKYSAMCNDDGCLIDDGVVIKLGENDYYFTTSTGRAGATIEWFRYHTRYDGWTFHLVNLTDAFGAVNLAGPRSREVLQKLTEDDLSKKAFPYGAWREMTLGGTVQARVFRLGFVGELSYEIHVPASQTQCVWDWLLEAGREVGIRPFGLEAQNLLRLEKGRVIIGQDTEIRTNLLDLGLGFLWKRDKAAAKTVGAPALRFAEKQSGRLKLVGFQTDDSPKDGAVIVDDSIRGYVTSARFSSVLGRTIGLALVEEHLVKPGTLLNIFQENMGEQRLRATVVGIPFYDPDGIRLRA